MQVQKNNTRQKRTATPTTYPTFVVKSKWSCEHKQLPLYSLIKCARVRKGKQTSALQELEIKKEGIH